MAEHDKYIITNKTNIYYRTKEGRYHGKKFDRYFMIRIKSKGEIFISGMGWESDGVKLSDLVDQARIYKMNARRGIKPRSMKEEYEINTQTKEQ